MLNDDKTVIPERMPFHYLYVMRCFRREVLKEKLREKLELEKRALRVVERLLEDSVTEEFLIDCVGFTNVYNRNLSRSLLFMRSCVWDYV